VEHLTSLASRRRSLYVEKVEVGEEQPRTIISGLVKFVSQEELLVRPPSDSRDFTSPRC